LAAIPHTENFPFNSKENIIKNNVTYRQLFGKFENL